MKHIPIHSENSTGGKKAGNRLRALFAKARGTDAQNAPRETDLSCAGLLTLPPPYVFSTAGADRFNR